MTAPAPRRCLRARLLTAALAALIPLSAAGGDDWQTLKGTHFLVQHRGQAPFAAEALRAAEAAYGRVSGDLGFERRDGFWLFERRVTIRIYETREAFSLATGAPAWASGKASYSRREISGHAEGGDFIHSVLPHEVGHLVFREFVGFSGDIPLWLDEGVAQWEQPERRARHREAARALAARNELIPLRDLINMDPRCERDADRVNRFYAEAVSLVGYLVGQGSGRFTVMCRQLRDGRSLEDAARAAYGAQFRTLTDVEVGWIESLRGAPP
jgi:hypothetical protein